MHLGTRNICVPTGHRSESRPGGEIHAGEAERGRDERSRLRPVGTKRLAVFVKFGVIAPLPQLARTFFTVSTSTPRRSGERFEIWGERHNRADVQIAVRQTIESLADAEGERVVNGRVTKGALDAR